jgi:hypothetical protein
MREEQWRKNRRGNRGNDGVYTVKKIPFVTQEKNTRVMENSANHID